MTTKTRKVRELNEDEMALVTGGCVPSPGILYREAAEKAAETVYGFVVSWTFTPPFASKMH
jgi:bacteriocin-like protein